MDIGEYKRTTIVRPLVIPVPQRERETEEPTHQPQQQPIEEPSKVGNE